MLHILHLLVKLNKKHKSHTLHIFHILHILHLLDKYIYILPGLLILNTVAHARVPTGHKTAQKQTRNLRHSNGGVPKHLVARQNRGCRGNPIPALGQRNGKNPHRLEKQTHKLGDRLGRERK